MAGVNRQQITDRFAIYNADCMEVLANLPAETIHMSIYSPPFAGLYHYSSSDRDLSNARNTDEFWEHYGYVIDELARVTMPGRITAVHAAPVPTSNSGKDALIDFPGQVIRAHEARGWQWMGRFVIWKEPLAVRNRTMAKNLAHKTIVTDAAYAANAAADELLVFRRTGANEIPIEHPNGLTEYAGGEKVPHELERYRGHTGNQIENRYSHWIWRRYASSIWDDIRIDRVLPFRDARDEDDEKHVHPLQLDVIDRAVTLWSNPGENVLTPFMGVGSEVYEAVRLGRHGIGIELKPSYFEQAVRNMAAVDDEEIEQQPDLLAELEDELA